MFASKADQVSRLNVQIKDGLTEIQSDAEEIQLALRAMQVPAKATKSKLGGNGVVHTTQEHQRALQAGVDSLMSRLLNLTNNFKQFLIEHQRLVSKQEKRKERLIGPQGSKFVHQQTVSGARKSRILPQH